MIASTTVSFADAAWLILLLRDAKTAAPAVAVAVVKNRRRLISVIFILLSAEFLRVRE
jgi:hypothetical protein